MKIGSLFSGIGGLERGLELCGLGPVIWQCDADPHARAVLAQHWPAVHRFTDVKEIGDEAPPVDIICGGFPCQDISNAGKRAGIDGERSGLWSEFARIVRVLRPRVVFVENVRPLLVRGIDRVLGDLADLGFDAEWEVFRASDVGAPHLRERIFVLAYRNGDAGWLQPRWRDGSCGSDTTITGHDGAELADADRERRHQGDDGREHEAGRAITDDGGPLADADGSRWGRPSRHVGPGGSATQAGQGQAQSRGHRSGDDVADPVRGGRGSSERDLRARQSDADRRREDVADTDSGGCSGLGRAHREQPQDRIEDARGDHAVRPHRFPPGPASIAEWDGPQPAIRRGDDGVPGRSHRLRLLGNSCVAQQAALAWVKLSARAAANLRGSAEAAA